MKKIIFLLNIFVVVLFSACMSETTARNLENANSSGSAIEVEDGGTYSFKSSESQTVSEVSGSVMSFGYNNSNMQYTSEGGTSFVLTPTGEITPYTNIKSIEGTNVDLTAEVASLVEKTIPQGTYNKKSEGIMVFSSKYKGTYQKGEIIKDSQKYYYYITKVSIPVVENGITKSYTYLVKTVVNNDSGTDLLTFEDIIRSLKPGTKDSVIDLTEQTSLIKKLETLIKSTNYSSETLKQEIYKAVDDFYVYVENAYIDSSIDSNKKRAAAVEYVKNNSFDYVESTTSTIKVDDVYETITKLLSNVKMAYRDDLEGALATAENYYESDVDGVSRTIGNLEDLEDKFELLLENKIKEDSLQEYIYNKEFWKNVVISELRDDRLIQDAISYIVIGNLENIRGKLGETTYPVTSGLQPLQNYEEQLKKVTKYSSYEFYNQQYFLPKNSNTEKQLNIEDYLMINGSEKLSNDTSTKLGKTEFSKGIKTQRYVSDIFNKAYKNILNKKLEILSLRNKEYFDKIETAYYAGKLTSLSLTSKRSEIQEALENLINTVKIYDSNNIFDTTLSLNDLKTSGTYQLTFDKITGKIQNITLYKRTEFLIPISNSKINLEQLVLNIINDSSGIRLNTGVKTSLVILNNKEN